MEVYVVNVMIRDEKYYLADLRGTISRNKTDAVLFPNENVAYYYATEIESIFDSSLGKVESLTLFKLVQ